jgi:hypothetical protein
MFPQSNSGHCEIAIAHLESLVQYTIGVSFICTTIAKTYVWKLINSNIYE